MKLTDSRLMFSIRPQFSTISGLLVLLSLSACAAQESAVSPETVPMQHSQGPFIAEGLHRSGVSDRVRDAMSRVPRHQFVGEGLEQHAYEDRALPIGHRQTISQPYIVGLMTEAADVRGGSKVLEVGTGSGYQAAVLAEMGAQVFSVEIVPELAERAQQTLSALGYGSVQVRSGDGWKGWPEQGPFDAILVTAAAPAIPPSLLAQLADNGRLIIPVEQKGGFGEVMLSVQREGNTFKTTELGPVRFVPLTGHGRGEARGVSLETLSEPNELERLLQSSHAETPKGQKKS